jgi:hypothetical protein
VCFPQPVLRQLSFRVDFKKDSNNFNSDHLNSTTLNFVKKEDRIMKGINSKVVPPNLRLLLKVMLLLYIYVTSTVIVCRGQSKNKSVPKGEAYLSFTGNGAWCWFSDPRHLFKGRHRRIMQVADSSGISLWVSMTTI